MLLPVIITQTGSNEKDKVDSLIKQLLMTRGPYPGESGNELNVYLMMGPSIHTCQVWHPNETRPAL